MASSSSGRREPRPRHLRLHSHAVPDLGTVFFWLVSLAPRAGCAALQSPAAGIWTSVWRFDAAGELDEPEEQDPLRGAPGRPSRGRRPASSRAAARRPRVRIDPDRPAPRLPGLGGSRLARSVGLAITAARRRGPPSVPALVVPGAHQPRRSVPPYPGGGGFRRCATTVRSWL